jgi:hypothetical protein
MPAPLHRGLPAATVLALGLCTACTSSPSANSAPVATYIIKVVDTAGVPVEAAPVRLWPYHQATSPPFLEVVTDGQGLFAYQDSATAAYGPLDSLVAAPDEGQECATFDADQATIVHPRAGDTLTLQVRLPAPAATVAPGESCAVGFMPFGGPLHRAPFYLHIIIDSITDQVHGRWRLDYQASITSEDGTFTGAIPQDSMQLALIPYAPGPGCNRRYNLSATLDARGAIELARMIDINRCYAYPSEDTPFRMLAIHSPGFPP